jgi:hypothetical protein
LTPALGAGGATILGGLEQFDEIAGGIFQQDLRSAWPYHDFIAELEASSAKSFDFGADVIDDELDSIPTTGTRMCAVRHRSPSRALGSAQEQSQISQKDVGEGRSCTRSKRKTKVGCVKVDGGLYVIDHIADVDSTIWHSHFTSWTRDA